MKGFFAGVWQGPGFFCLFFLMICEDLLNINKNILTFDYAGAILAVQNTEREMQNLHNPRNPGGLQMKHFINKHPFLAAVLLSLNLGMILVMANVAMAMGSESFVRNILKGRTPGEIFEMYVSMWAGMIVYGGFIIFPFVLTAAEIILLVKGRKDHDLYRKGRIFDIVGVTLGVFYSLLYLSFFSEVSFGRDWYEQLANRQTHTPIYTEAQITVIMVALVAVVGYLVVNYIPLNEMPPLMLVLGMAAIYMGAVESVVWGIQVFRGKSFDFFLLLLPLNCLLLTARTVSHKMWEWNQLLAKDASRREQYQEGSGVLHACNRFLAKSERWPLAAFLLMWPLLGILIGILLLLGQKPDAVIRAFTETSDWNLSQRVAPQNIYYDEHYLCTVAAGGHESIVKPRRLGVRHGHQVIVNRQLCVANAFEQVLEERTPRFHRAVRHFYDTYGFPVAKLIHSKYTADLIYFLMKPLEWIFLIVLYLTDVNPENRIAIQYTGKSLKDFQ